jgi:hypothetical protein
MLTREDARPLELALIRDRATPPRPMPTPPAIFPVADGRFVVQCGICLRNSPPMDAASTEAAWDEAQRVGWRTRSCVPRLALSSGRS